MFRTVFRALTLLSLLISRGVAAQATIIRVPADQPSLSAALGAAADGDTILLADGIYSGGYFELYNRGVTLQSESGNPNACILDATSLYVHYDNYQSPTVTLRGLTFRNSAGISLTL